MNDGTYSLWTSEKQAGVHPFIMGRATDSTWFGMYANLINAQDWYIKNNRTTGEVTVKVRAAGGLGDLFFMAEHDPHNIT